MWKHILLYEDSVMFESVCPLQVAVPAGLDVCMPYHSIPTKTNDDDRNGIVLM
jgi:hypothetical protein